MVPNLKCNVLLQECTIRYYKNNRLVSSLMFIYIKASTAVRNICLLLVGHKLCSCKIFLTTKYQEINMKLTKYTLNWAWSLIACCTCNQSCVNTFVHFLPWMKIRVFFLVFLSCLKHIFWHQTCTLLAKISPYQTSSEYKFRYMSVYMDKGFGRRYYILTRNFRVYMEIVPLFHIKSMENECCVLCYTLLYSLFIYCLNGALNI